MLKDSMESFNIVLTGFISTGKTSLGKELYNSLNRQLIDTDKLIEKRANRSIAEIIEKYGIKYFRQLEKEIIEEISGLDNTIISCGGGVPLDPENIRSLRKKGRIILLEADSKTILERTTNIETRPLLKGKDKLDKIQKMMDERRKLYIKAADVVIDTNGKELSTIRDEIMEKLNLQKDQKE